MTEPELVPGDRNLLNPAVWDVVVLALAARTTEQNVNLVKPVGARGVIVTVNVTAISVTPVLTPTIKFATAADGAVFESLLVASTNLTAIIRSTYVVLLGVGAASDDVTQVAGFALPRAWRFTMAVGDADSATYEVSASYLQ